MGRREKNTLKEVEWGSLLLRGELLSRGLNYCICLNSENTNATEL